ncbi:MAG TPA: hypothetical protein VGI81_13380 [Tepidisphaeraceae bacterium]|jgi:hypothetical protein
MDPREFHHLADRLAQGNTPAEFRTAIGRAYYAAFNVAAEGLRTLGFRIGKGGAAHGEVVHCVWNAGDPAVTAAADLLNALHSLRNRADYHLDKRDVEESPVTKKAVEDARMVTQAVDAAFTGPQRTAIQAAIAKWRRENGYP